MQSSHSLFLSNFTDKHTRALYITFKATIKLKSLLSRVLNVQTWLMHGRDDSVPQ